MKSHKVLKTMVREMGRKAISDEDFNKQLQMNVYFVGKCFSDKPNKGFQPQLVAVNMKHEAIIMMLADMPIDSDDRHRFLEQTGRMLAVKQADFFPVCVFFMSEAWMRGQVDKGEIINLPIRDNPAKTEAMVISGMTVDGRMNMATFPMYRGATDIVLLGKPSIHGYEDGKSGIVTNILACFYKGYFSDKKKGGV